METTKPKRYGRCSVCLMSRKLGRNGLLKLHTDRVGKTCDGSAKPPGEAPPKPDRDRSRDRVPGSALWREVLARDGFRCKKCGFHSADGRGLEPNHIVRYADGGLTVLDNLDTLCGSCHAELSWLWLNQPPVAYQRWLQVSPATFVMRALLAIAGETESPSFTSREILSVVFGVSPDVARRILFSPRTE